MMTFREFVAVQDFIEAQSLHEGAVGKAAILAQAAASRREGDESDKHVRHALQAFARAKPDDPLEVRLQRFETGLEALLVAQLHRRRQIGSAVGVSVAGHLTTQRTLDRSARKRRRR